MWESDGNQPTTKFDCQALSATCSDVAPKV